mmetsp:Transcript_2372/g.4287  ORF Transcript_2372/g.4287 Transcript_2372/m.4287 type:complete len:658 (-) Transcript_2372:1781-3754(-)
MNQSSIGRNETKQNIRHRNKTKSINPLSKLDSRNNYNYNHNHNNNSYHNNNRGGRGNYNNNSNSYGNNRYGSPNRGRGDGYGGGDRKRDRPGEWNHQNSHSHSNYHHGSSTARRRFHPPQYGSPGHGYGHGHRPPPNLDGLDELRNLGYCIPRGFPAAPTSEEKAKKSKHVALLAITIDDLSFENIWKGWIETLSSLEETTTDDYFVSVLCHAKFPQKVTSEWLRQRLLTFPPKQGRGNSFMDPVYLSRAPEWGSVDITRAMLDLLQDGLKIGNGAVHKYEDKRFCPGRFLVRSPPSFDGTASKIPPVDHFLYISESCIPVVTAPEFFCRISDSAHVSWLNASHRTEDGTPKNKYEDDQFAGINRRIPGQYRWKGDQWLLLSRKHASSIIAMDRPFKPAKHQLWQSFRHINASDEMFFPTALALLGDLRYTKDGGDTQKGRSKEEESSSSQTGETSFSSGVSSPPHKAHSEADPSSSTAAANAAGPSSSPPMKNQAIILTPVTYTDWTEGMKNPALFTKGVADLKRVGKLARDKGCLVARKFATHISIPGVPLEDQKITGDFCMEDWAAVIKDIQSNEEKTKPMSIPTHQDKSSASIVLTPLQGDQAAETTESGDAEDWNCNDNDNGDRVVQTRLGPGKGANETEDDDYDEGETQLE